jgi:hypothetical protein
MENSLPQPRLTAINSMLQAQNPALDKPQRIREFLNEIKRFSCYHLLYWLHDRRVRLYEKAEGTGNAR